MTLIACMQYGDGHIMAADRLTAMGHQIQRLVEPKILRFGSAWLGFSGRNAAGTFFRSGKAPELEGHTDRGVRVWVLDAMKAYREATDDKEAYGIVLCEAGLFQVWAGGDVLRCERIATCGCGDELAYGCLYTNHSMSGLYDAFRVASARSNGVMGPEWDYAATCTLSDKEKAWLHERGFREVLA